jgi:hypothetical protein
MVCPNRPEDHPHPIRNTAMSREQKGNKESKKKPIMTAKEKKAAKRSKIKDKTKGLLD